MLIESLLEDIGRAAITQALGVDAPAALKPTQDKKLGDYQFNAALGLAKQLGKPPREIAQAICTVLAQDARFASVEIAGPGFLNVRLAPAFVHEQVAAAANHHNDGIPTAKVAEHVVVDFSSPNIAKQMHIGHIRSTVIGDSLARTARKLGHKVTGDNHIGDWGTQFGLLIVGMRAFGSAEDLERDALVELERVYKLASARAKEDEAFATEARAELKKLQDGDPENHALWQKFVATTRSTLDRVYNALGVKFDVWLGESAYNDMLAPVCAMLIEKGLARENEGALCIFFGEHPEADKDLRAVKEPFIVRKSDGAYLYASTDIATVLYRRDTLKATRVLYVVDARQGHHFKQLFQVARLLGVSLPLAHVGFGTILGDDNKPLRTRDGGAVRLEDVMAEAIVRAKARMLEEGMEIPPDELDNAARKVGLGAIKYADLKQNRSSDYVFDWDKLISFKGNAGPYLHYTYARFRSVLRKAAVDEATSLGYAVKLEAPEEFTLAKTLMRFGQVVFQADQVSHPHLICDHLYELARDMSAFYEACNILKSEGDTKTSRLALVAQAGRQLRVGLGLLGIETLEKM
jgi:arginyl-tRNA synthetase